MTRRAHLDEPRLLLVTLMSLFIILVLVLRILKQENLEHSRSPGSGGDWRNIETTREMTLNKLQMTGHCADDVHCRLTKILYLN